MAKVELTFSSKGNNYLTKQLMVNAIDTDPNIKESLSFILDPTNKYVNSELDIKYVWNRLNKDKINMLLGFLFFIPHEEYRLLLDTEDVKYGIYTPKTDDYIVYTKLNFVKKSKEFKEKNRPVKNISPENQLANFIKKCK